MYSGYGALALVLVSAHTLAASPAREVTAASGTIAMFGRALSLLTCGKVENYGPVAASSIHIGQTYQAHGERVTVRHIDVSTASQDVMLGNTLVFRKGQNSCRAYEDRKDLPVGQQCGRIWIYVADCNVLH